MKRALITCAALFAATCVGCSTTQKADHACMCGENACAGECGHDAKHEHAGQCEGCKDGGAMCEACKAKQG